MCSRQAAKDAATHGKQAVEDVASATYKAGEETVGATQGAAESTWQKIKDTVTGHHVQDRVGEAQQLARDTLEPPQEQAETTWQKIKDTVTGKTWMSCLSRSVLGLSSKTEVTNYISTYHHPAFLPAQASQWEEEIQRVS